jgi:polyribonucleotide nucleotidyltransferase
MLEGVAKEVEEKDVLEAIKFGYENLRGVNNLQRELVEKCGKPKAEPELRLTDVGLVNKVRELAGDKLLHLARIANKEDREQERDVLCKELEEKLLLQDCDVSSTITAEDISNAVSDIEKQEVRKILLSSDKRIDGRDFQQLRDISCEVQVLPRTHGSSLFTRGQTQSLAVTTLGTRSDEQLIEALEGESFKSFMLHYSFPPFSVGEIRPVRGPGRREIGHGALAERALCAVMPSKDEFPYTVRVVSEILESNGSSSMATVCAAALSLMDAGVPIKDAVAGIAMGLVKQEDKYVILTDISGLEDHCGDMDFKLAGTKKGMTAVQLDLKIDSIDFDILSQAIDKARAARFTILDKMNTAIAKPREELSDLAPRITIISIDKDKIGELIGPGGKTIKKIIAETGATIDIEDDGRVLVSSVDAKASEAAIKMIRNLTEDVEVGQILPVKVVRIAPFGAFCEIAPGKEGLIHISELSDKFVKNVTDLLQLGDQITAKVIGIDDLGRISLSKKQAECENDNT